MFFAVIIYDLKLCQIKASIFRIIDAEKMNERVKEAKAVKKKEVTMEKMKVSELMRPVSEFPKISCEATFAQAVDALEKAQQDYASGKAPQRILLVYDDTQKIVGKLSPLDVVYGLEPNYDNIDSLKDLSYYRIPESVFENIKEKFRLWQQPLPNFAPRLLRSRSKTASENLYPIIFLTLTTAWTRLFTFLW